MAAFLKGKESCCAPGRIGAHIWEKVWFHVQDLGGMVFWGSGDRPDSPVTLRWIPAHLPKRSMEQGLISDIDYYGNQAVDRLAKQAVEPTRVPAYLLEPLPGLAEKAREVMAFVAAAPAAVSLQGSWADVQTQPKQPGNRLSGGRPRLPRRPAVESPAPNLVA